MTEKTGGFSCAVGCWAMAAGIGVLAFVLMLVLGEIQFFGALFLSGGAAAALGLLFQAVFCRELPDARGAGAGPIKTRGLRAEPPADPAEASVSYAHAKREAEAAGRTPPASPAAMGAPAGARVATPAATPAASTKPAPAKAASDKTPTKPIPPADPVPAGTPAPGAAEAPVGSEPARLDAPRNGKPDDLKKIKGVGPKLEAQLHEMGYYHFDQIANWSADEVAWVDENVEGVKGRVTRDDWVGQARTLAANG